MTTDTPHIPTMHSYEEIGEFWDTHSLADYWDQTEPAEFEISPQLTKKGLLANMANPTETKKEDNLMEKAFRRTEVSIISPLRYPGSKKTFGKLYRGNNQNEPTTKRTSC